MYDIISISLPEHSSQMYVCVQHTYLCAESMQKFFFFEMYNKWKELLVTNTIILTIPTYSST